MQASDDISRGEFEYEYEAAAPHITDGAPHITTRAPHIVRIYVAADGPAPPPAPTPTPEPTATPDAHVSAQPVGTARPLYDGACPALIYDALGRAGCMISWCESGWDPGATGLEGERGWFQVHPYWHSDATWDPAGNVAAAVRISGGGSNWSQWSTRSVLATGVCPNARGPYPY